MFLGIQECLEERTRSLEKLGVLVFFPTSYQYHMLNNPLSIEELLIELCWFVSLLCCVF